MNLFVAQFLPIILAKQGPLVRQTDERRRHVLGERPELLERLAICRLLLRLTVALLYLHSVVDIHHIHGLGRRKT